MAKRRQQHLPIAKINHCSECNVAVSLSKEVRPGFWEEFVAPGTAKVCCDQGSRDDSGVRLHINPTCVNCCKHHKDSILS